MSYAQDSGYTPQTVQEMLDAIRVEINSTFLTSYDETTFVGTNWYKYVYAIIQKMQENEIKMSEIFQKLQEYIALTNERIQRPTVSHPGLIDSFASAGYVASTKPPSAPDAGKIYICVDVDDSAPDYADTRLEICTLIKDYVAAGMLTQGSESETITLSNGQSFDFKYALPDRITTLLRLTATISENNTFLVPDDEEIRQKIKDNLTARYKLGLNFEPQKYLRSDEIPWAGEFVLEWSTDDGFTYHSDPFDADFDELYDVALEDIEVVVT